MTNGAFEILDPFDATKFAWEGFDAMVQVIRHHIITKPRARWLHLSYAQQSGQSGARIATVQLDKSGMEAVRGELDALTLTSTNPDDDPEGPSEPADPDDGAGDAGAGEGSSSDTQTGSTPPPSERAQWADLAMLWVRHTAARNTLGEHKRAFSVELRGPKTNNYITSARFVCSDIEVAPGGAAAAQLPGLEHTQPPGSEANSGIPLTDFPAPGGARGASSSPGGSYGERSASSFAAAEARLIETFSGAMQAIAAGSARVVGQAVALSYASQTISARLYRSSHDLNRQKDEIIEKLLGRLIDERTEKTIAEVVEKTDTAETQRNERLAMEGIRTLQQGIAVLGARFGLPAGLASVLSVVQQDKDLAEVLASDDLQEFLKDKDNRETIAQALKIQAEQHAADRKAKAAQQNGAGGGQPSTSTGAKSSGDGGAAATT